MSRTAIAASGPGSEPGRTILPSWLKASGRTLVSFAVTLLGLAALTFFIGRLLPLDPVVAVLGDNVTQEAYQAMYKQLGLDQPLYVQFGRYIWGVLHLDFGMALTTGKPVMTDIARVFPATIELASVAIVIGTSLGGPTGYAINPARDLGPRIAHAILPIPNKGSSDWGYSWVPVVGPIIGGVIAGVTSGFLLPA